MVFSRRAVSLGTLVVGLAWPVAGSLATPSGQATAAQPADASSGRMRTLARFAGGQVTVADLQAAIAGRPAHAQAQLASEEGQRDLLRDLVDYELLVLEAERRGYGDHPVVLAEVAKAEAQVLIGQDYAPAPAAVPAEALAERVKTLQAEGTVPELRRGTLLVVKTRQQAAQARKALAGKDATAFRNHARTHSEHPSRQSGGVFGEFDGTGRLWPRRAGAPVVPKEIVKAAFATPGESISEVFSLAGGFALLRVELPRRAGVSSIAALEPAAREALAVAARDRAVDGLVQRLRAKLPVQLFAAPLGALGALDGQPPGIPSGTPAAPLDPSAPYVAVEPDDV